MNDDYTICELDDEEALRDYIIDQVTDELMNVDLSRLRIEISSFSYERDTNFVISAKGGKIVAGYRSVNTDGGFSQEKIGTEFRKEH